MHLISNRNDVLVTSRQLAQQHYENFPVGSLLLPAHLRDAVSIIYRVAREADDIADEGDASPAERLQALKAYEDELLLIQAYIQPHTATMQALATVCRKFALNVQDLLDLISAFQQDVSQTRYQTFDEVLDYCRRSANPIGRLMLQLYQQDSPQYRDWSDQVCTALQLINFYQDIAIDLNKHEKQGRVYLSLDELATAGLSIEDVRSQRCDMVWQQFFLHQLLRAEHYLQAGKPLGRALHGRIGLEVRLMIAGGERILAKLKHCQGDIYQHRPTLTAMDWPIIIWKAVFKQ